MLKRKPKNHVTEQIKQKVRRTQAKVCLIKGTGCSILSSLKSLRENIEKQSFQHRFVLCDEGCMENVLGAE